MKKKRMKKTRVKMKQDDAKTGAQRLKAALGLQQPEMAETSTKVRGEIKRNEHDRCYFTTTHNDEPVEISTFVLEPTEVIVLPNDELVYSCRAKCKNGHVYSRVVVPSSGLASTGAFRKTIENKPHMAWMGTSDNTQSLRLLLAGDGAKRINGTYVLGRHETRSGPAWIGPEHVITHDGVVGHEAAPIRYLDSENPLDNSVHYPNRKRKARTRLARAVLPDLAQLHVPEVVLSIISYFFAALFRPEVMRIMGAFPHLAVAGTHGSGKSTLVKTIAHVFGVVDLGSASETSFALLRLLCGSTSIPVILDEYKPQEMSRTEVDNLHKFTRQLYNQQLTTRGKPTGGTTTYRFSAPLVLVGERSPEDAAIRERQISVAVPRNVLDTTQEYIDAYERVRYLELGALATPIIIWSLRVDTDSVWARAKRMLAKTLGRIGSQVSGRPRDALQVVMFGLLLFRDYCSHIGVEKPRAHYQRVFRALVGEAVDEHGRVEDELDRFVKQLRLMAEDNTIKRGAHYWLEKVGKRQLLYLSFPSCWKAYEEHRRLLGMRHDQGGKTAMRKLLAENEERYHDSRRAKRRRKTRKNLVSGAYVLERERRTRLDYRHGRKLTRVVVIDYKALTNALPDTALWRHVDSAGVRSSKKRSNRKRRGSDTMTE